MSHFKPILFSTPMIEAIEAKRKTQTRRTTGLKEINKEPDKWLLFMHDETHVYFRHKDTLQVKKITIPAKPDTVFWVRETWQITDFLHPSDENYGYIYKASDNGKDWEQTEGWTWKPSIFMPKAAARIFLQSKHLRIARLQMISNKEAIAEGVENYLRHTKKAGPPIYKNYTATIKEMKGDCLAHCADNARHSFETLWNSIHGKDAWNSNPWVWVYEFEQTEKPKNFTT